MNVPCRSFVLRLLAALSLALLVAIHAIGQSAPSASAGASTEAVATVDGQPISAEDLLPYIQGQLLPLRQQEYELQSNALQGVIDVKLVEAEAKRRGLTTEALLDQEVNSKVSEPTESEIYSLYIVQKEQLGKPYSELRGALLRLLKQARIQEARDVYYKQLRQRSTILILLSKPTLEVASDPARLRGSSDAPITIVEFSDFQCPYCRSVEPALKNVLAKYNGRVNLAYHDMPLRDIHPNAQLSAEASRCAAEQGKFWEYHDLLFEHQDKLGRDDLVEHARALKLDDKRFDACLASGKYKAFIEQERQVALKGGITGTPGFLINGKVMTGNLPQESLEKLIEEALANHSKAQVAKR